MASRFQQQSLQRKVTYLLLIVALFGVTFVARQAQGYGLKSQAEKLQIGEQSVGDVELSGSAVRLTLTGSRGFAVCYLWLVAQEKQKRHEWNELEMIVNSVIKLQPHFISPWLFQSWNLSYNVSVECDRVKDKYFYVTRGIQLLDKGVKQNKDSPDLPFYMGVYTQNKMGISDETNTMRSLFQLSVMDPVERNPARFRRLVRGRTEIDLERFEDFCRHHPQLVRRLREGLHYQKPEEIVDFLAASYNLPSRYEYGQEQAGDSDQSQSRFRPVEDQFPILPPPQQYRPTEVTYEADHLGDDFDSYAVARAWFGYAQDPIARGFRPHMTTIIFQGYPARAQAHIAERWQAEGWFDRDGWPISDWFPRDKSRPEGAKKVVQVGTDREWSKESWDEAHAMYVRHGHDNGLYKTDEELKSISLQEKLDYNYKRMLTNYDHFYQKTTVERQDAAIAARKIFYQANRLRLSGKRTQAMELFEDPRAFGPPDTWANDKATGWKRLMLDYPDYRTDEDLQEENYIDQERYVRLVRERRMPEAQNLFKLHLVESLVCPQALVLWVPPQLAHAVTLPVKGPFDDRDDKGSAFIGLFIKNRVRQRNGLPPLPGTPTPKIDYPGMKPTRPGSVPGKRPTTASDSAATK